MVRRTTFEKESAPGWRATILSVSNVEVKGVTRDAGAGGRPITDNALWTRYLTIA
ncbi:hypothetical protein [Alicyclobacillus mengziensis]|uniref:Uncharacterized protein n=1 Tax=Alicyclobacillus mengziensis TaxID=2931921 RepID=A0A9X7Z439_9BACL|nr:hypothetical protein [Alicyclobacillus mengziensis]QSO45574.1 hypothetical protein JZ786_13450 [Alicyclobacillus mengziensis]QSO47736.1 hypothetical protein JZ786_01400 [Alicyclobacillus mengziensis]QSO49540.1 hypothetical protein JZ786_11960 [Alicyclobacillus mengziensis]